ncbi:MAG: hypothetical protein R3281_11490, partial [Balneolaceae bacterium]|nr:hypothetical protein [Balneolaceae bacterium]
AVSRPETLRQRFTPSRRSLWPPVGDPVAFAARVANEAKTKLLVLTHFSARYTNQYVLLREARDDFFPTWVATELRPIFTDPAHEKGIIQPKVYLKEINNKGGKNNKNRSNNKNRGNNKRKKKKRFRKRKSSKSNRSRSSSKSSSKRTRKSRSSSSSSGSGSRNYNKNNNGGNDNKRKPKQITPRTPFDDFDRF